METKEYRHYDKSEWGDGPWQDEPDKIQWQDEGTGFPCLIVRNRGGALCGYVGVPESHPDFENGYDAVDVEVHGGLTFANFCTKDGEEAKHICHVPSLGEPHRVWWLGFDCSHAGDSSPAYDAKYREQSISCPWNESGFYEYRDIPYVKAQVARLARQLQTRSAERSV